MSEQPNSRQAKACEFPEKTADGGHGRNSLLAICKKFGDTTTMHGMGRAINSKRALKRVVWSLLVIAAICVAVRGLYKIVASYYSYPVTTTTEFKYHRMMSFPAVTFCNLNPARRSHLDQTIQEALSDSVKRGDNPVRQERIFKIKRRKVYNGNNARKREDTFYHLSDMLLDCRFDMKKCLPKDFTVFQNAHYGRCFTFNAKGKPRTMRKAGNRNGLILELDIQQDDYLPFVSTSGIKVLVHPQSDMAFPEDSGIMVGPGRATCLGISKISLSRMPPPWGECVVSKRSNMVDGKYEYTSAVCQKSCYQLNVYKVCGCCDNNFPCNEEAIIRSNGVDRSNADQSIPECDEGNRKELRCLNEMRGRYFSGKMDCIKHCRPACYEESYTIHYATGSWPVHNFVANLARKSKRPKEPLTDAHVIANFLRVEVYYDSFVEEIVTTKPAYDWDKLLSDIGGQLGLWLGFSIMTAVEILELVVAFLRCICC